MDWETETLDVAGALNRVADDMGQDWVKDPIYRSDTLKSIEEDPDQIHRRLAQGALPRRGLPVPVPKTSLLIRPAVELRTVDRVAYQALVEEFAVERLIDLPNFVCGWRYAADAEDPDDLADNGDEWRRYEQHLDVEWNQGAKFIVITDIAGFFQSIPHPLLTEQIGRVDSDIRKLLLEYLRIWNPIRIGLPQRVLASSLLANMYLEPLDEVLADYRSVRWMDDVALFCDSRREAIKALIRIQDALHPLGLLLSDSKTTVVPFEEAEDLLVNWRFRNIEYQLRIGDPAGLGAADLSDVWEEIIARPDTVDRTKFSFCVTRFAEEGWDEPVTRILDVLDRIPHVSDHASRYLRGHLDDPSVLDTLTRFLKGGRNLYAWEEYRLATLYWHAEALTKDQLDFVRRKVASPRTYWASKGVFLRALGRHGTREDARVMVSLAENESHPEILRSLLIGAIESGKLPGSKIQQIARDDKSLTFLVAYLKGRNWKVPSFSF